MGKIEDVEIINLDLGKGEHLKNEELAKINPQSMNDIFFFL